MSFNPGLHIFNYIDKPDFTMNDLVATVNHMLSRKKRYHVKIPYRIGLLIGKGFDAIGAISGRRFAISSIRVKKFCANSVYNTAIDQTGFIAPVALHHAIRNTVRHEFIETHNHDDVFYTE
jgi:hypothetical protein